VDIFTRSNYKKVIFNFPLEGVLHWIILAQTLSLNRASPPQSAKISILELSPLLKTTVHTPELFQDEFVNNKPNIYFFE
jgi:hypothetical protein